MRALVSALNLPTVIVTHDRTDGIALGDLFRSTQLDVVIALIGEMKP